MNLDLTETQYKFVTSAKRFTALIAGVGAGKTFALCLKAVQTANRYPGSTGAIVASTYRNLHDFILPMISEELWRRTGGHSWDDILDSYNKQHMIVRFINGSSIFLRSCDNPDALRGPNLSWFAIDEASKVPHKVWPIMVGRARVAPEQGWIATTPRGRNWVWEEFARRQRRDYTYYTGTTLENKHLSDEYKKSLLDSYSGSFLEQEVYGEFVGWEGLVYQIELEKHHATQMEESRYAIAGVDWGWIDPTVILVGQVGFDGKITVVEEFVKKKATIEEICEVAAELREKWNIRTFWCDSARPEYLQAFRNYGLDARKGQKALDAGIATVHRYLTEGLLKFDFNAVPELIDEADTYHYEEDDMGQVLKSKPIDRNNHCMDAMRYMVYSHSRMGHATSRRGNR